MRNELTIEFEVYCSECGHGICNHVTSVKNNVITIEPCSNCISKRDEEIKSLEKNIEELGSFIFDLEQQIKGVEE